MSEQSAKAFVKKLASDPSFRSKIDAAKSDAVVRGNPPADCIARSVAKTLFDSC